MRSWINGQDRFDLDLVAIEEILKARKVIGLDVDKTIAGFNSDVLYEAFEYWLQFHWSGQILFLITNQGGPACHAAGWGDQYPTVGSVVGRLAGLIKQIKSAQPTVPVWLHICWAYKDRNGKIMLPEPGNYWEADKPEEYTWDEWRKPGPGMILDAIKKTGVEKKEFVYIGDAHDVHNHGKADDLLAAKAAGVDFIAVEQWLNPIKFQLDIAKAELGSNPHVPPGDQ